MQYPKQSSSVGQEVAVRFHDDPQIERYGTIVREDVEEPFVTIIEMRFLNPTMPKRYTMGYECIYRPVERPKPLKSYDYTNQQA